MPFGAPAKTFGRQKDLTILRTFLAVGDESDQGRVPTVVLWGGPGMGKTHLACEFVFRYGCSFAGGVFWLSFAAPAKVQSQLEACGRRMGLGEVANERLIERVIDLWTEPVPRLLVFDNCEEAHLLDQWRPPYGGCHVLVTSRNSVWDKALNIKDHPLKELDPESAAAMLKNYHNEPDACDERVLASIASELGCVPLALHQAGSYLARYRAVKPEKYLAQIQDRLSNHDSMKGRGAQMSPSRNAKKVIDVFEESIARLSSNKPVDVLSKKLLRAASFLAPGEPPPEALLRAVLRPLPA